MKNPQSFPDTPRTHTHTVAVTPAVLVACLCADWCGTCRQYQDVFTQAQVQISAQFPALHFVWMDVEDEADLIEPVAVDDFPTLLVATPDKVLFFGTVTPHLTTLQRLVQTFAQQPDQGAQAVMPEIDALAQRLWHHVKNPGNKA